MRNKPRNWRLFRLAKELNCRPSALLGIKNDYVAFCLDEAIVEFGTALDNALDKGTEGAKNRRQAEGRAKHILEKWLADDPPEGVEAPKAANKAFRAPVATKKR